MQSFLDPIGRVVVLGTVPSWVTASLGARAEAWSLPSTPVEGHAWCSAADVVRHAAARAPGRRVLVVTALPLYARGTPMLFGFADARRGVAVVSTARLTEGDDPARWRQRLANVVAHEAGHLDRLGHCPTPGCLMNSVQTVAGLDRRGHVRCGRCPRTGVARQAMAALAFASACAVTFAALDQVAVRLKPSPSLPFSCAAADGGPAAYLQFNATPVAAGDGSGTSFVTCRSAADADALNRAFQVLDPPVVEGIPGAVQHLLQAKGLAGERCPDCHIARRADTLAAARFMKGLRP